MGSYAFEFYAGNREAIQAACEEDRIQELHEGGITPHLALFPYPFDMQDFHANFPKAIASFGLSTPDLSPLDSFVLLIRACFFRRGARQLEIQPGLFLNYGFCSDWIASIAAAKMLDPRSIQAKWSELYFDDYEEFPEWHETDHSALIRSAIEVFDTAHLTHCDLVQIWWY